MKRYYFVSDDLKDLALVEKELQQEGVSPLQMHLVSDSGAEAQNLGLHQVASVFRNDIIYSMLTGLAVGAVVCSLLIGIGFWLGVTGDRQWALMIIICILILGFCTWEGGLFGIQVPNRQYRRFARVIRQGRHLFFVDVARDQSQVIEATLQRHAHLKPVGRGIGEWYWWFFLRSAALRFAKNI